MTRKGSQVRVLYGPLLKVQVRAAQSLSPSSFVRACQAFVKGVAVALRAAPGDDLHNARRQHLARVIARDLETQSYAQAMVDDVADVDEWRAAARMAGRIVGLRVRTTVLYGAVYVRAIDLPTPEWVRERSQRQLADFSRRLPASPS
jgi:hypothetical protein